MAERKALRSLMPPNAKDRHTNHFKKFKYVSLSIKKPFKVKFSCTFPCTDFFRVHQKILLNCDMESFFSSSTIAIYGRID